MSYINVYKSLDKGIVFIHKDDGWYWRSEDDGEEFENGPFATEWVAAKDFMSGDDSDRI